MSHPIQEYVAMFVARVAMGVILLFFGRSLYWAFVAIAGFLIGSEVAALALASQAPWVQLLAALALGILGAFSSLLAQRVAFSLGGLYADGYLAAQTVPSGGNELVWIAVGAVLGVALAVLFMDWAIIILSCLAGAAAIVAPLALEPPVAVIAFWVLVLVGIFMQGRHMRQKHQHRGGEPD